MSQFADIFFIVLCVATSINLWMMLGYVVVRHYVESSEMPLVLSFLWPLVLIEVLYSHFTESESLNDIIAELDEILKTKGI